MNTEPLTLMKHLKQFSILAALLLPAVLPAAEIPWWAFTGGGGIGQHGAVALGGAMGPIAPALSPATGGKYTLTGGFWSALSGQPKAASPLLTITAVIKDGKVVLSWPLTLNGFALEYTAQLGSGIWHAETEPVVNTASRHTVTVTAQPVARCYRLRSL